MASSASARPRATIAFQTMHQQVVDSIGRMIAGGEVSPGDLLPNETNLCAELGVSRGALREAVKSLVGKGLLEVRPRTGTRVRPRDEWNTLDPLVLGWILDSGDRGQLIVELNELRVAVEPAAAALAAARSAPQAVAELSASFDAMSQAADEADRNRFVEADTTFHDWILAAGQNELFISLGQTIQSVMRSSLESSSASLESMRASIPLHRAVLDAIARKDEVAANSAMHRVVLAALHDLQPLKGSGGAKPTLRTSR